jgi:hypothetical protein
MKITHAICLALLALPLSCDYPERFKPIPDTRGPRVCGIELYLSSDSIIEQETLQARAYVILDSGRKEPAEQVTWESINEDILTVDREGTVTGLRPGLGTIRACMDGFNAAGTVEVRRRIDYSRIMLHEVFYDAAGSDEGKEFIEIYNDNEYPCDIGGMMVVDGSTSSSAFTFPRGSVIGPKSLAVIAQSADGFTSLFGKAPDYGNFSFSLNNNGETVMLMKSDGSLLDAVYIKGGTEDFMPPESWGSVLLPAAVAGHSVCRINYTGISASSSWSSGPPTPGL